MISSIEVQNFKGFRHLKLSGLGPFHVLAGPNGSGKSSFLEILEFVKDLLLFDVQEAVSRRQVSSLRDLTFDRRGGPVTFDIALDEKLFQGKPVRYRLEIQESVDSGAAIVSEVLVTKPSGKLVWRVGNSPVYYAREDGPGEDYFSFPWTRSALSQVPPDEQRYPIANSAKKLLTSGVRSLDLNGGRMRLPCPPSASANELLPTGNNLARVAGRLLKAGAEEWLYHLRLALEDLESISWHRQDDSTEYLMLHYRDGLEIPSWLASFGTLRTLALTLPAFLPADDPRLYLFEEPENGIHPKAIEIVMSAIQSIPNAQTFVTTHSPIVIQQSGIKSLLLFSKVDKEIVVQHGQDNQTLRDWDGFPDLGTVVASRVLG